jgi:hypothetical protein
LIEYAVPEELVLQDVKKTRALGLQSSEGPGSVISDETLAMSSRYYLSMLEIMKEAGLEALSLCNAGLSCLSHSAIGPIWLSLD